MKVEFKVSAELNIKSKTVRLIITKKSEDCTHHQIHDIAEFSYSLSGLNGFVRGFEREVKRYDSLVTFEEGIDFGRMKNLGSKIRLVLQKEIDKETLND